MDKTKAKKTSGFNFGVRGWLIVILALVGMMLMASMTTDALNITVPAFAALGLDAAVLYTLSTVAGLVGTFGGLFVGWLCKKYKLRYLWSLCLLLAAVCCLIWANATNYVLYFIGFMGTYLGGMGFAYVISNAVITNWMPRKKGPAMGVATCGFPISATITTLLLSKVVQGGISHVYYMYAAVCFVMAVIVFLVVRDYPEEVGKMPDNEVGFDREAQRREYEEGLAYMKQSPWTAKKVLASGTMWALVVAVGIGALIASGIMSNFMGKFLESGFAPDQILLLLVGAGLLAIPGSILIGWVDTKLGTKKTAIIVSVIGVLAVAMNLVPVHIINIISLPFIGCMLGGVSNLCVGMTVVIWGRYDFNNVYRILQPLCSAVGTFGIMIVGAVGTKVNYFAAYVVLLVLAVVSLIFFCLIKDKPATVPGTKNN